MLNCIIVICPFVNTGNVFTKTSMTKRMPLFHKEFLWMYVYFPFIFSLYIKTLEVKMDIPRHTHNNSKDFPVAHGVRLNKIYILFPLAGSHMWPWVRRKKIRVPCFANLKNNKQTNKKCNWAPFQKFSVYSSAVLCKIELDCKSQGERKALFLTTDAHWL